MDYKNRTVGKVLSIKVGRVLSQIESSRLKEKEENAKWLFNNYDELAKDYLNQFVAVKNQKPVGHGKDLDHLLTTLTKAYGDDFCTVAIEYISDKEPVFPIF